MVIVACGKTKQSGKYFDSLSSPLSVKENFSVGEQDVAIKICYAFQSKKSNFPTNYANALFKFKVELTSCSANYTTDIINTYLRTPYLSKPMFFDTDDTDFKDHFVEELQTNADGYLESICDKIFKGESFPSPVKQLGDDKIEQIEFFKYQDIYGFSVYVASLNSDKSSYIKESFDRLEVLVDESNAKYGQVQRREIQTVCSDGSIRNEEVFVQTAQ